MSLVSDTSLSITLSVTMRQPIVLPYLSVYTGLLGVLSHKPAVLARVAAERMQEEVSVCMEVIDYLNLLLSALKKPLDALGLRLRESMRSTEDLRARIAAGAFLIFAEVPGIVSVEINSSLLICALSGRLLIRFVAVLALENKCTTLLILFRNKSIAINVEHGYDQKSVFFEKCMHMLVAMKPMMKNGQQGQQRNLDGTELSRVMSSSDQEGLSLGLCSGLIPC